MIQAAAGRDGVLVEDPEPRGRLAGVQNPGARSRNGLHELPGHGGDPAHPLQKIQRHPLGGQDVAEPSGKFRQDASAPDFAAVLTAVGKTDLPVQKKKGFPEYIDAGHDQIGFGHRPRGPGFTAGKQRPGRYISGADILVQRGPDQLAQLLFRNQNFCILRIHPPSPRAGDAVFLLRPLPLTVSPSRRVSGSPLPGPGAFHGKPGTSAVPS